MTNWPGSLERWRAYLCAHALQSPATLREKFRCQATPATGAQAEPRVLEVGQLAGHGRTGRACVGPADGCIRGIGQIPEWPATGHRPGCSGFLCGSLTRTPECDSASPECDSANPDCASASPDCGASGTRKWLAETGVDLDAHCHSRSNPATDGCSRAGSRANGYARRRKSIARGGVNEPESR